MPSERIDDAIDRLAKEYVEASRKYHDFLGRFVEGGDLNPGEAAAKQKQTLTETSLEHLNKLDAEVAHARARWHEAVRQKLQE